jgi:cytochrome c oxidase subunit 2
MFDKVQKALTGTRSWHIILALGLAVTLAACGGGSAIDPLEVGDPERGREIYETGGGGSSCKTCHTLDGSERIGPSLQGISELAGDRVPDLSAEEYLRQSIVDPSAYLVEDFFDLMPKNFQSFLSEEDIDDLVAFMLTQ